MTGDIVRVFICGAHSTGKTTVIGDVVKKVSIATESEVARDVIREMGLEEEVRLPRVYRVEFEEIQKAIIERQCQVEMKNELCEQDYIMDRGIDPIVYAEMYLGKEAKNRLLELETTKECIARYKNSIVVVLKPHRECIKDDGFRISPVLDDLNVFTGFMIQTLQDLGIHYVFIEELDRQKRLDAVVRLIETVRPRLIKNTNRLTPGPP